MSLTHLYAWAVAVFLAAIGSAWCLGQALQDGQLMGTLAMLITGAICLIWLFYIRREVNT